MPDARYELLGGKELDRVAREQVSAEIARDEGAPLEWGAHIAWALTTPRKGITDGLSELHRVGYPLGNLPATTCGVPIPAPALWVPLSPALIRVTHASSETWKPCRFCASEHARQLLERDAA